MKTIFKVLIVALVLAGIGTIVYFLKKKNNDIKAAPSGVPTITDFRNGAPAPSNNAVRETTPRSVFQLTT